MPVAIGYILGPIFEQNLRRAESHMTGNLLEPFRHPIAILILAVTVMTIVISLRANKRAAEREAAEAAKTE